MTEEKLAPTLQKTPKRRARGLVLAVLALFVAVVVLFRQPIAEGVGGLICAQQNLVCRLKITRLDFGGLTFRDLDVRGPKSPAAALSATRLGVDFDWSKLFSPRAKWVGGDEILVRLDLSGTRPLLGDLDQAVKAFTKGPSDNSPAPRLDFKTLRVIGETPLGPVEAHGAVAATGPDAFVVQLTSPPAKLRLFGASLQLAGGELNANVAGGEISGRAKLNLVKFQTENSNISDVKVDISLDQSAGVLKGAGSATLGKVSTREAKLDGAQAQASIESAAVDPTKFDLSAWLSSVRKLDVTASAGEGSFDKTGWTKANLKALVEPKPAGGSGGDISFVADGMQLAQGEIGMLEVVGAVALPAGGPATIQGELRANDASLTTDSRQELAKTLATPLQSVLPGFAIAAAGTLERAGRQFDVVAPWSAEAAEGGFQFAALSGASIKAASGFAMALEAGAGKTEAATFTTGKGGSWKAAGSLNLSGGGGPQVTIDLARAEGAGQTMSMAGAAQLHSWKVGDDALAAEASGLEFNTTEAGGSAGGQFTVRLDGGLAGGVWKAARGTGAAKAAWTPDSFYVDAPNGLVIQWDEARYGDNVFGAGALHYAPKGRLAERLSVGVVGGQGVFAEVKMPLKGRTYSGDVVLGETAVNWRAEGGLHAGFDAAPSGVALKLGERATPIKVADIRGQVDLRQGWRLTGTFSGGEAVADEASIADIAGKFDLDGQSGSVNGNLSDVTLRVTDPQTGEKRRYEDAKFVGGASLDDGVAEFSGVFTVAKKGVQIATVKGSHDLETGKGSLTFAPTPLIFLPKAFQPYDLSPLLRGPANVVGRVDLAGAASWSGDGINASATAELKKLGFVLASAGVFEGVSGKVDVSDLMKMTSAPGQTITIDKVTLGLPIEKGAIKFQLIGYDAIRLEGAEWPFVGGFIRIKPTDFKFSEERNGVTAQAVNWDLNKIVELFKIPDVKLNGIVSGDIPVTFSTGSARIDKAELIASQTGGVIQYTGSTGDAAAQSDPNAKMLFDALKDFRYKVLKLGIDGDIAGDILLTMNLRGSNPTVLAGSEFDLNIGVDSPLMNLLNTADQWKNMRSSIGVAPTPN